MSKTRPTAPEPVNLRTKRFRFYFWYSVAVLAVMTAASAVMPLFGATWRTVAMWGSPLIFTATVGLLAPLFGRTERIRFASWIYFVFVVLCGVCMAWMLDLFLMLGSMFAHINCSEAGSNDAARACDASLSTDLRLHGLATMVGIAAILPPIVLGMLPWRRDAIPETPGPEIPGHQDRLNGGRQSL